LDTFRISLFLSSMKKNIPNILTVLRLILTFVIILLFVFDIPFRYWIILGCFFVASFTDFLDGFLARKWKVVSDFGIVFDSLFDKILVLSVFLLLIPYNLLPVWIWVLFLIRELFVDGIKNFCLGKGHAIPAIKLGKWKFFFQIIMIHLCLLLLIFPNDSWMWNAMYIFAGMSLLFSYVSAIVYTHSFTCFLQKK